MSISRPGGGGGPPPQPPGCEQQGGLGPPGPQGPCAISVMNSEATFIVKLIAT